MATRAWAIAEFVSVRYYVLIYRNFKFLWKVLLSKDTL